MIFVFHGANQPKLRDEFLELKKKYADVKFLGEEIAKLPSYLFSQSLFGGQELVVLEDPKVTDAAKFANEVRVKRLPKDVIFLFSSELNRQKLSKFKGLVIKEFRDEMPKNVFPLLDALLAKEKKKALSESRRLLSQGNDLDYLLRMFTWQFRNLARVKSGAVSGINPYVVKKVSRFKKSWTESDIKRALSSILVADIRAKKGKIIPIEFLVDEIIGSGK